MRILITSRIFAPEPAAASFRLVALAEELNSRGHQVTVVTVRPPRGVTGDPHPYRVERAPVLRDRDGYVRGYLQYLSYDLPLAFRLLFRRRPDAIITEPPPTTGGVVRVLSRLRRTPYCYYAADIWSDAAQQTGAPGPITRLLRGLELWAIGGAARVFSVSSGVTRRLAEFGIEDGVLTVGNGVRTDVFGGAAAVDVPNEEAPYFLYAGTASEWHGADVFVRAIALLSETAHAGVRLRFVGGGSERDELAALATDLGVADRVSFHPTMPLSELTPLLRGTVASLASVRPGSGYDFAFPTKLYSSAACGAPVIYAGPGPAAEFAVREVDGAPIGEATAYDPVAVAAAMRSALAEPAAPERRRRVAEWALAEVSLSGTTGRIADAVEELVAR